MNKVFLLVFLPVTFKVVGQNVPKYLISNDIPYSDINSAFSFTPFESDHVISFEEKWKYFQISSHNEKTTSDWLPFKPQHIYNLSDERLTIKNEFLVNDNHKWTKVIFHIPACKFHYIVEINGFEIKKYFPNELENNIDVTQRVRTGKNVVLFRINDHSVPEDFLQNVYLIKLKHMHISNMMANGLMDSNSTNYHDLNLYGVTHNFSNRRMHGYLTKPSMYNQDRIDSINYLSYQANELSFDSVDYPIPICEYHFQNQSLPQESIDFFGVIVPKTQKWKLERPVVYNVSRQLYDDKKKFVAVYSSIVGFRVIDITDQSLSINDKIVRIKGINFTHSNERLDKKINFLKKNNFNTIYIPFAEANKELMDLCDRHGLYVVLNVNLSNLKSRDHLATSKDIFTQIVLAYAKHPSLIAFALVMHKGVEHKKELHRDYKSLRSTLRTLKLPILIVSDGFEVSNSFEKKDELLFGIENHDSHNMYEIAGKVDGPIFVFPKSTIGFRKQSINHYFRMLEHRYPSNIQGLIFDSDVLSDNMSLKKIKYEFQDVKMEWIKNTAFSYVIENHYLHTNLNQFDFLLEIFHNGDLVYKKDLGQIDLSPGKNKLFNFSLDFNIKPGQVYEFRTSARLKEDKVWAKMGYIVSQEKTYILKDAKGKLNKIQSQDEY